ncbi:MAG: hypothetical protein AAGC81_11845 [Pseudomonadota bacterium]
MDTLFFIDETHEQQLTFESEVDLSFNAPEPTNLIKEGPDLGLELELEEVATSDLIDNQEDVREFLDASDAVAQNLREIADILDVASKRIPTVPIGQTVSYANGFATVVPDVAEIQDKALGQQAMLQSEANVDVAIRQLAVQETGINLAAKNTVQFLSDKPDQTDLDIADLRLQTSRHAFDILVDAYQEIRVLMVKLQYGAILQPVADMMLAKMNETLSLEANLQITRIDALN